MGNRPFDFTLLLGKAKARLRFSQPVVTYNRLWWGGTLMSAGKVAGIAAVLAFFTSLFAGLHIDFTVRRVTTVDDFLSVIRAHFDVARAENWRGF